MYEGYDSATIATILLFLLYTINHKMTLFKPKIVNLSQLPPLNRIHIIHHLTKSLCTILHKHALSFKLPNITQQITCSHIFLISHRFYYKHVVVFNNICHNTIHFNFRKHWKYVVLARNYRVLLKCANFKNKFKNLLKNVKQKIISKKLRSSS